MRSITVRFEDAEFGLLQKAKREMGARSWEAFIRALAGITPEEGQ